MPQFEHESPIFIVGSARSGTSLLASALGSHRRIVVTPEIFLFVQLPKWRPLLGKREELAQFVAALEDWKEIDLSQVEYLRRLKEMETLTPRGVMDALYGMFMERADKPRCGDKTNANIYMLQAIAAMWPDARVIHTIRDGRDVVASQLAMPTFGRLGLKNLALEWKKRVAFAREHRGALRHYLEVRYEDLVCDFEPQLRTVCGFIGEDFEPDMLRFYELDGRRRYEEKANHPTYEGRASFFEKLTGPADSKSIGRWKESFSPAQTENFAALAGDLLRELGYPS